MFEHDYDTRCYCNNCVIRRNQEGEEQFLKGHYPERWETHYAQSDAERRKRQRRQLTELQWLSWICMFTLLICFFSLGWFYGFGAAAWAALVVVTGGALTVFRVVAIQIKGEVEEREKS